MAIRKIVEIGDDLLRSKSREVTVFDSKLHNLLDDMKDTMNKANGVGIAAPQVGILRRAVVIDTGEGLVELINPVVISKSGEICDNEGCLSIPGKSARIRRPKHVKVEAYDRNGKKFMMTAEDYMARAVCHEIDHLDGILYVDLINPKDQEGR